MQKWLPFPQKSVRAAWLTFLASSVIATAFLLFFIGDISPIVWPVFYGACALLAGIVFLITSRPTACAMTAGCLLIGYVALYSLDAAFGGYDPYFTSDGRLSYRGVILVHNCIMWQPRLGSYYNEYRHDFIGVAFYPLLQLDRRCIHRTHSIGDNDFPKWWKSLAATDIHPEYRSDYTWWKAVEAKYTPALESAKARGDKAEAKRIRGLIRKESEGVVTNK